MQWRWCSALSLSSGEKTPFQQKRVTSTICCDTQNHHCKVMEYLEGTLCVYLSHVSASGGLGRARWAGTEMPVVQLHETTTCRCATFSVRGLPEPPRGNWTENTTFHVIRKGICIISRGMPRQDQQWDIHVMSQVSLRLVNVIELTTCLKGKSTETKSFDKWDQQTAHR